jgi:hypothetical protein
MKIIVELETGPFDPDGEILIDIFRQAARPASTGLFITNVEHELGELEVAIASWSVMPDGYITEPGCHVP